MTPLRLVIALALAVVVGRPTVAEACQPPGPCPTYKHHRRPYSSKPGSYMRVSGTTFRSFTRSKVVAFLTGAAWEPTLPTGVAYGIGIKPAPKLRFVDSAKKVKPQEGMRHVVVGRIEYRETDKVTLIEVDSDRYALAPCEATPKRMCLSLRNDLYFDTAEKLRIDDLVRP